MPYRTPYADTGERTITLIVPVVFRGYLLGALLDLAEESHWRTYGDITIDRCLEMIEDAILQLSSEP